MTQAQLASLDTPQQIKEAAQQIYLAHQAEQQAKLQKQQEAEQAAAQKLIDAFKTRLDKHLPANMQTFLRLEVVHKQDGSLTTLAQFVLTDEHDNPVKGYIFNESQKDALDSYRVVVPRRQDGKLRPINGDYSGGSPHYCLNQELTQLLLRLIGEWDTEVAQAKLQLEQQRQQQEQRAEANRQRQETARQQQEAERQQQEAEQAARQAVHDEIDAIVQPVLERAAVLEWEPGKVVECYLWKWVSGAVGGEDGDVQVEHASCFSWSDQTNDHGYIVPVDNVPIKLMQNCYATVSKITLASLEDCRQHHLLEARPSLIIHGISRNYQEVGEPWQWGGDYTHHWYRHTVPVKWIREVVEADGLTLRIRIIPGLVNQN